MRETYKVYSEKGVSENVEEDLCGNHNDFRSFKDGVPSLLVKVVDTHCAADGFCLDIAVVAYVGVLLEDQGDLVDDEKGDFPLTHA